MNFMSEDESAALVSHAMAYEAAREALVAVAGDAFIFPAVLAHGSSATNRFSIKSAATAEFAGLKIGSFWPANSDQGLPRHNSLILLFDQGVGRVEWVIEAGKVNAYRTAAADAVAADVLAREDAAVLAIFGTGNQALYECRAIARIRPIRQLLVVARDPAKGDAFVAALQNEGLKSACVEARAACEQADIVVTATPSRSPLFDADWIRPGTHVASMGSDAPGKQELPPGLFDRAALFCDQTNTPEYPAGWSSSRGVVSRPNGETAPDAVDPIHTTHTTTAASAPRRTLAPRGRRSSVTGSRSCRRRSSRSCSHTWRRTETDPSRRGSRSTCL